MTLVLMASQLGWGKENDREILEPRQGDDLFGDLLYKPCKRRESTEAFAYSKLYSKWNENISEFETTEKTPCGLAFLTLDLKHRKLSIYLDLF